MENYRPYTSEEFAQRIQVIQVNDLHFATSVLDTTEIAFKEDLDTSCEAQIYIIKAVCETRIKELNQSPELEIYDKAGNRIK